MPAAHPVSGTVGRPEFGAKGQGRAGVDGEYPVRCFLLTSRTRRVRRCRDISGTGADPPRARAPRGARGDARFSPEEWRVPATSTSGER